MPDTPMKDISALQVPGGQFKLKGIILFVPVPKCITCSHQLYCGRPRGDSKIPVLPSTEIQKDNYITYMPTYVIYG